MDVKHLDSIQKYHSMAEMPEENNPASCEKVPTCGLHLFGIGI
jgi:hypothetical protein